MAHIWVQDGSGWGALRLDGVGVDLEVLLAAQPNAPLSSSQCPQPARLVRADAAGEKPWALITHPSSDLRVNGRTVPAGLCLLDDRDEIRVREEKLYFSTENLASVEQFPGSDRQVFCGRCRQLIETGTPAVCCPSCGVWYNESADLPCWTYSGKCTFCGQATALDAGFSWTPEEL